MVTATSRYYSLTPARVGTPWVESITGYVSRLAEAHCISTQVLVKEEIFKHVRWGTTSTPNKNNPTIVSEMLAWGFGDSPYIKAIEQLTHVRGIHRLTLQTLPESFKAHYVMRGSKAWCPECYQAWRESGDIIYDPLLWVFNAFEVCPLHGCWLEDVCPGCHCSFHSLSPYVRSGHCAQCGAWLGRTKGGSEGVSQREVWHAKEVVAIVEALQLDSIPSGRKAIGEALEMLGKTLYHWRWRNEHAGAIYHPRLLQAASRSDVSLKGSLEVCRIHGLSLSSLLQCQPTAVNFKPWLLWSDDEEYGLRRYLKEVDNVRSPHRPRSFRPELVRL